MALLTVNEGSRAHRAIVVAAWTSVAVALISVVVMASAGVSFGSLDQAFRISQINDVVCYSVAILGLNLVIGYSGQLSVGHSAFVGIGAYTTIILVSRHGWSFLATIPVSVGICFVLGLLVGLPALRIKGLYLAIVTLSLAYIFPMLVLKFHDFTGGANGLKPARGEGKMVPPSWAPFADAGRLASPLWIYTILVTIAVIAFVLVRNFVRSRPGRALVAVRDSPTSAAVSGVNVPLYKVATFGASAALGGVAGSMLMINRPFASDVQFGLLLAIMLVVGLIAGGTGRISGAVPGAAVFVFVPYFAAEWTRDQSGIPFGLRQVTRPFFSWLDGRPGSGAIASALFGVGLIMLIFLLPGGLASGFSALRARLVEVVPNPSWMREGAGSSERAPFLDGFGQRDGQVQ